MHFYPTVGSKFNKSVANFLDILNLIGPLGLIKFNLLEMQRMGYTSNIQNQFPWPFYANENLVVSNYPN